MPCACSSLKQKLNLNLHGETPAGEKILFAEASRRSKKAWRKRQA
jgi:hypothetical protein